MSTDNFSLAASTPTSTIGKNNLDDNSYSTNQASDNEAFDYVSDTWHKSYTEVNAGAVRFRF